MEGIGDIGYTIVIIGHLRYFQFHQNQYLQIHTIIGKASDPSATILRHHQYLEDATTRSVSEQLCDSSSSPRPEPIVLAMSCKSMFSVPS